MISLNMGGANSGNHFIIFNIANTKFLFLAQLTEYFSSDLNTCLKRAILHNAITVKVTVSRPSTDIFEF